MSSYCQTRRECRRDMDATFKGPARDIDPGEAFIGKGVFDNYLLNSPSARMNQRHNDPSSKKKLHTDCAIVAIEIIGKPAVVHLLDMDNTHKTRDEVVAELPTDGSGFLPTTADYQLSTELRVQMQDRVATTLDKVEAKFPDVAAQEDSLAFWTAPEVVAHVPESDLTVPRRLTAVTPPGAPTAWGLADAAAPSSPLEEGHEDPTPKVLNCYFPTVDEEHPDKLGPGPGHREATGRSRRNQLFVGKNRETNMVPPVLGNLNSGDAGRFISATLDDCKGEVVTTAEDSQHQDTVMLQNELPMGKVTDNGGISTMYSLIEAGELDEFANNELHHTANWHACKKSGDMSDVVFAQLNVLTQDTVGRSEAERNYITLAGNPVQMVELMTSATSAMLMCIHLGAKRHYRGRGRTHFTSAESWALAVARARKYPGLAIVLWYVVNGIQVLAFYAVPSMSELCPIDRHAVVLSLTSLQMGMLALGHATGYFKSRLLEWVRWLMMSPRWKASMATYIFESWTAAGLSVYTDLKVETLVEANYELIAPDKKHHNLSDKEWAARTATLPQDHVAKTSSRRSRKRQCPKSRMDMLVGDDLVKLMGMILENRWFDFGDGTAGAPDPIVANDTGADIRPFEFTGMAGESINALAYDGPGEGDRRTKTCGERYQNQDDLKLGTEIAAVSLLSSDGPSLAEARERRRAMTDHREMADAVNPVTRRPMFDKEYMLEELTRWPEHCTSRVCYRVLEDGHKVRIPQGLKTKTWAWANVPPRAGKIPGRFNGAKGLNYTANHVLMKLLSRARLEDGLLPCQDGGTLAAAFAAPTAAPASADGFELHRSVTGVCRTDAVSTEWPSAAAPLAQLDDRTEATALYTVVASRLLTALEPAPQQAP